MQVCGLRHAAAKSHDRGRCNEGQMGCSFPRTSEHNLGGKAGLPPGGNLLTPWRESRSSAGYRRLGEDSSRRVRGLSGDHSYCAIIESDRRLTRAHAATSSNTRAPSRFSAPYR
ncbi:uncharacterized protein HMPREF1120_03163 [Exophiala dermatitidis NIH/UT8656]|uniref:Uncharacterized protein n=1 Tax=Exophiala dermatitidis (strain ATCC 34100 / CBS 525.76 / NIH/UT8656) TaxID=858893 RepID=H6BV90_EXODN|nr:uncharacterized protein HMPREF1120_03163 [Exophiala dermatitidis NIH/UT8656]EHY55005.1 hypothetical protein HMPREF1120_03163 [Exophiala dermatitidis NIH/UT8656]